MIILIILIILVLLSFNLFRNLFKSETAILDDVKLKEEESNNNGFALMLEQDDGTYEESYSSSWPIDESYLFNDELSGCVDMNGNKIEDSLSFDTSTNTVIVSTNKTAFCYIYFDINKTKPNDFIFYLGGSENPIYTITTSTTAYLSWTDSDIESYCIQTNNDSSDCNWNNINGTTTTVSYILNDGDGDKTAYAFLKNKIGNISESVIDTIILDTKKPNCSSITGESTTWTSSDRTITVECDDGDGSGCVNLDYSVTYSKTTKISDITIADNAGNTTACSVNVYVDKTKPQCYCYTYYTNYVNCSCHDYESGFSQSGAVWDTASGGEEFALCAWIYRCDNTGDCAGTNSTCGNYNSNPANDYLYIAGCRTITGKNCDKVGNCNSWSEYLCPGD